MVIPPCSLHHLWLWLVDVRSRAFVRRAWFPFGDCLNWWLFRSRQEHGENWDWNTTMETQQPRLTGILLKGRGMRAMQSYLFHLYVETTLQHILVLLITTLLFCFILTPTMDSNFTKKWTLLYSPLLLLLYYFNTLQPFTIPRYWQHKA